MLSISFCITAAPFPDKRQVSDVVQKMMQPGVRTIGNHSCSPLCRLRDKQYLSSRRAKTSRERQARVGVRWFCRIASCFHVVWYFLVFLDKWIEWMTQKQPRQLLGRWWCVDALQPRKVARHYVQPMRWDRVQRWIPCDDFISGWLLVLSLSKHFPTFLSQ